jgi:hypothetical protein
LDPAGFSTETWTATAVAPASGDYTVNWDYSGFHAFFEVTAFLNTFLNGTPVTNLVSAGPQDCCTPPSGGFDYTGSYTFIGINAGDSLGFTFGGSNFDSNNVLRGTLNLQQVLEPASLALLGIGLAGVVFSKRRKLT